MKKRYSEEQIVAILKEGQTGIKVSELCRKYGVSEPSYYAWKSKFSGMEISDVRKLRHLEDENRRLKTMVAEQALDIQALKAINAKNW